MQTWMQVGGAGLHELACQLAAHPDCSRVTTLPDAVVSLSSACRWRDSRLAPAYANGMLAGQLHMHVHSILARV
jgi:hypothetical protein